MRDIEFRMMMGHRMQDSDGFTYPYGAVRDGSKTARTANRPSVKRSIRNDKRGARARAFRRAFLESVV